MVYKDKQKRKEYQKQYHREYHKNNKERMLKYIKDYDNNNPEKLRIRRAKHLVKKKYNIEYEQWLIINKQCRICGWESPKINNPHGRNIVNMHHIDKNHENNDSSNLIGLCPNCHMIIHNLGWTIEQLIEYHRTSTM